MSHAARHSARRTAIAWAAIVIGVVGSAILPFWKIVLVIPMIARDLPAASTTLGMFGIMIFDARIVAGLLLQLFFVALILWGAITLLRAPTHADASGDEHEADTDGRDFRRFLSFVATTMGVIWLAATGLCTTAVLISPVRLGRDGAVFAIVIVTVAVTIGGAVFLIGRWLRPRTPRDRNGRVREDQAPEDGGHAERGTARGVIAFGLIWILLSGNCLVRSWPPPEGPGVLVTAGAVLFLIVGLVIILLGSWWLGRHRGP